jgi:hypothetical protein
MRTSLTRAVAGVAIAAAAVITTAGLASASTTPPAPTTLSIAASQSTITAGQKSVISGTLLSGTTALAHKTVWLARVNGSGNPVLLDAHFTGKLGRVFFNVYPKTTVSYELVFRGNANYAASSSSQVTVTVTPAKLPTNLSIVALKNPIKAGHTDTIVGQLRAGGKPLAGRTVWLFRVVKGKLVGGNGHLTGKLGRVFFTIKPAQTTRYILVFFGTPKLRASFSGVVTVIVK